MSTPSNPTEAERRNGHAANAHTADARGTFAFYPLDFVTLHIDHATLDAMRERLTIASMTVEAAAACMRGNISDAEYRHYADGLQFSFDDLAGLLRAELSL